MSVIPICLGIVALYYNIFIGIVFGAACLWLFHITDEKKVYIRPWKYLFLAGIAYLLEEIFVLLRVHNILITPSYLDGFFGIAVVTCFIYMLLLQKKYVEAMKK